MSTKTLIFRVKVNLSNKSLQNVYQLKSIREIKSFHSHQRSGERLLPQLKRKRRI